jgi:RNA polymerase sigma-70 factor (ECF subfamily)
MNLEHLKSNAKNMETTDILHEIYCDYSNKIYNFAYQMTGDVKAAEDITQETFVKVIANIEKFRGESRIYTWVYSIAKNLCLRFLENRKRSTFRSVEELIEKVSEANGGRLYDEPERLYYVNQVKDGCLLGVLRCLSFNQRIAFILNVIFDLPIADISNVIDKSENATRILVHRARKNIKEFLCDNCSLYDGTNSCRCENLVSFSLKQGWIKKYNPSVCPDVVEAEIKALKNEVMLYRSIASNNESVDLKEKILLMMSDENLHIFSVQKVK